MSQLNAGVSRIALQPRIGTDLVGYSQKQKTLGIHDEIYARALVLENDDSIIALCSIEVCFFPAGDVTQMRQMIVEQCPIPSDNIFIFATHTHSAPAFFETGNWIKPPIETAVESVVHAYAARQPAQIGIGSGQLQGYSINRRFLDRPVDPSISVIRVDTLDGKPLSILGNYGNHAVVMGYDNEYISGDWPGLSSMRLESQFGDEFVALFSQGGAAEVNPITETVRQKLSAGHPVQSIGSISTMYGHYDPDDAHSWNIGDRGGGTFIEAETIAIAYNAEVMRVWRTIELSDNVTLWAKTVTVDGKPSADEPSIPSGPEFEVRREFYKRVLGAEGRNNLEMEIMMLGIGEAVLVGHPGETFSENAVEFRKICQQMGIPHPILITYANGWFSYLTPENAYPEGGYEVFAALSFGLSRKIQDRFMEAIRHHLQSIMK